MALEVTLLAIVTTVMVWVIRVENGGLLNVFFVNVPSSLGEPAFELISNINVDYFVDMILFKPLSLPILESMPESIGGGQEGVEKANRNPNREPVIFWLAVVLFFLAVFLIIAIQVINCCCCCGRGKNVSLIALPLWNLFIRLGFSKPNAWISSYFYGCLYTQCIIHIRKRGPKIMPFQTELDSRKNSKILDMLIWFIL